MEVKAIARNIKSSPQKTKIAVDVVRGMLVSEALPVLKYMQKKVAKDVYKVIHSARANAVNNHGLDVETLYISEIHVGKARRLRRFKSGSRGRVKPINRDYSHITVVLKDIADVVSQELATEEVTSEVQVKTKSKSSAVKSSTKESKSNLVSAKKKVIKKSPVKSTRSSTVKSK